MSDEQARLLSKYAEKVVLFFDGDDAGRKAIEKAWLTLEKAGLFVQVCVLADDHDPDSYVRKFGSDDLENLLAEKILDAVIWFASSSVENNKGDTLVLHKLAEKVSTFFAQTKFTAVCESWAAKISEITGVSVANLLPEIAVRDGVPEILDVDEHADNAKSDFFEQDNCYFMHIKKQLVQQSNFVLRPLYQLNGINGTSRVFEAINIDGQKVQIKFDGRELVSLDAFCQKLERHGNFVFIGSQNFLKKLKAALFGSLTACKQIETLGWQPEHKIWAWENGIVHDGKFVEIDKETRTVNVGGNHFYLSETNENQENNAFRCEKSGTTLLDWISKIATVYHENDNGVLLVLYFLSSVFRDTVYENLRFFPILFGFGPKGSGKSRTAWSLSHLFGKPLKQINLSLGTSVGTL